MIFDTIDRLTVPVLDDVPRLGLLYDAKSGEFLRGHSFLSESFFAKNTSTEIHNPHGVSQKNKASTEQADVVSTYQTSKSLAQKLEAMDIRGELTLTVAFLFKAKGSADYVKDIVNQEETSSITACFTQLSRTEDINLGDDYQKSRDDTIRELMAKGKISPTHVVGSITYGKKMLLRMELEESKHSEKEDVKGTLEGGFDVAGLVKVAGKLRVNIDNDEKKWQSGLSFHLTSKGFVVTKQPNTIEEAVAFYKELRDDKSPPVPISMQLVPIEQTTSQRAAICYALGQGRCETLINAYSSLKVLYSTQSELYVKISRLAWLLTDLHHRAESQLHSMRETVSDLERRLAKALIDFRTFGTPDSHEQIESLLREFHSSHRERKSQWKEVRDTWDLYQLAELQTTKINAPFVNIDTVWKGMLDNSERIMILVRPNLEVGDLNPLLGIMSDLQRWRLSEIDLPHNLPCQSLYVDDTMLSRLPAGLNSLTAPLGGVEIFVWCSTRESHLPGWERLGDRWRRLLLDDGIYIGDAIKSGEGYIQHGRGQYSDNFTPHEGPSTFTGSWRNGKKHGRGVYRWGTLKEEQVWRNGQQGKADWISVVVNLDAHGSAEVVVSPDDSAEMVMGVVRDELNYLHVLQGRHFRLKPSIRMPGLRDDLADVPEDWQLKFWGFGLPGSAGLRLIVSMVDTHVPSASETAAPSRLIQPRWFPCTGRYPGHGFNWQEANLTGCSEHQGTQVYTIARAFIPATIAKPSVGLVLGKGGFHLEDGCYYALDGSEFGFQEAYEVLQNPGSFEWVWVMSRQQLDERRYALLAGFDNQRKPLFIARCRQHLLGGTIPEIVPGFSHGDNCHVGWGNREIVTEDFEILCHRL